MAASLSAAQAVWGHEVSLLSYAHADAREQNDAEPIGAQIPGWSRVRHVRLPLPSRAERLLPVGLRRRVRAIASEVDVAHLHRVWEPLVPAAAAELRRVSVPYILSPHGMLHPWSMRQKALKKRIAMAVLYRRALSGAAAFHALNVEERANIEELEFGRPIHIVANGVWLDEHGHHETSAFRAAWPQLSDDRYVLFMGRLHHKKGPDILIEAFAMLHQRLPSVRLVIAGDDSGARGDILRRIEAARLSQSVLLTGPLYAQQKQAALAGAACFCLPSRQEGFPVAVLEAMAESLPVVISEQCYMPQVRHEQAGFVLRLQASAFAEALSSLFENEAMRARMGSNARAMVQRDYTWPRIAQQMLDVYATLLPR